MKVQILQVLLKIEVWSWQLLKQKNKGKVVICASTGNTSASAAAYAARAGLKAIVVIPEGKIALGKLSQAVMYGAEIVSIEGNFDEALEIVKEIAENDEEIELVNSVNPYRIEGQKRVHLKLLNNWNKLQTYSQFQLETQAILLLIGKVLKNTMRKR